MCSIADKRCPGDCIAALTCRGIIQLHWDYLHFGVYMKSNARLTWNCRPSCLRLRMFSFNMDWTFADECWEECCHLWAHGCCGFEYHVQGLASWHDSSSPHRRTSRGQDTISKLESFALPAFSRLACIDDAMGWNATCDHASAIVSRWCEDCLAVVHRTEDTH